MHCCSLHLPGLFKKRRSTTTLSTPWSNSGTNCHNKTNQRSWPKSEFHEIWVSTVDHPTQGYLHTPWADDDHYFTSNGMQPSRQLLNTLQHGNNNCQLLAQLSKCLLGLCCVVFVIAHQQRKLIQTGDRKTLRSDEWLNEPVHETVAAVHYHTVTSISCFITEQMHGKFILDWVHHWKQQFRSDQINNSQHIKLENKKRNDIFGITTNRW